MPKKTNIEFIKKLFDLLSEDDKQKMANKMLECMLTDDETFYNAINETLNNEIYDKVLMQMTNRARVIANDLLKVKVTVMFGDTKMQDFTLTELLAHGDADEAWAHRKATLGDEEYKKCNCFGEERCSKCNEEGEPDTKDGNDCTYYRDAACHLDIDLPRPCVANSLNDRACDTCGIRSAIMLNRFLHNLEGELEEIDMFLIDYVDVFLVFEFDTFRNYRRLPKRLWSKYIEKDWKQT